jgi:hypothetical protein
MSRRYPVISGESSFDIETGRLSGYCIKFGSASTYIQTPAINNDNTIIVGVALKFIGYETNNAFLRLYDGATSGIGVFLTATGELQIKLGSTVLGTTVGSALLLDTWYWLELKVLVDNAAGAYELRIGESTVLSDTGLDTQVGANAYYDAVRLSVPYTSTSTPSFDDFYICNSAGTTNNDFLGNVKVLAIFPDGAGTVNDFAPSAGANFTCIDEQIVDDDTSYVESSTSGNKDTYNYEDISDFNIKGIQINTDCRETDASSFTIITVIRSDSAYYDDGGQSIGTTDYVTKRLVSEIDPATSAAWLYTSLNSAEFGIKVS